MAWTLQFSDDFNDSDMELPTHDAAWSNDEGIHLVTSNRLEAGGGTCRSHVSTALANDQAVELAMYSDTDFQGVVSRYTSFSGGSNDFQGYCALWNGGTVYLFKRYGGSFVSLGTPASLSRTNGDILRIESVGTSHTVLANGTPVTGLTSISDSDIASGSAGVRGISATYGDNFAAYDDAGGGGGLSIPIAMRHYLRQMGAG